MRMFTSGRRDIRNIAHKEGDKKLWEQAESTEEIEGKGRIGRQKKKRFGEKQGGGGEQGEAKLLLEH